MTTKPIESMEGPERIKSGGQRMEAVDGVPSTAVEKFAASDLSSLREELKQAGLDSWQAAELLSGFLMARGYGVSSDAAREMVASIEAKGCTLPSMQEALEKLALVM